MNSKSEVAKLSKLKMAKVLDSPTLNPHYGPLVQKIRQSFQQAYGHPVVLERRALNPKLSDSKLGNWHILISPSNKAKTFEFYKLLDIQQKIAISQNIKNFIYNPAQAADYSMIEFDKK